MVHLLNGDQIKTKILKPILVCVFDTNYCLLCLSQETTSGKFFLLPLCCHFYFCWMSNFMTLMFGKKGKVFRV